MGIQAHGQVHETSLPQERAPRILKIARIGHPVLRQQALDVKDPTSLEIAQIVQDMKTTLAEIGAFAGLAAPQVHIPLKIVLFAVPKECGSEVPLTVMINPSWQPLSDEQNVDWEGCFSLPDFVGEVSRYTKIRYSYQTLQGETINAIAEGFHARVIQHECDHLEGKLYVDRMTNLHHFGFRDEIQRHHRSQHQQQKHHQIRSERLRQKKEHE